MNRNLWAEWGPRFEILIANALWLLALPFALLLLAGLYPLGLICDWAESAVDKTDVPGGQRVNPPVGIRKPDPPPPPPPK